jgi:hypothetical protein
MVVRSCFSLPFLVARFGVVNPGRISACGAALVDLVIFFGGASAGRAEVLDGFIS